MANVNAPRGARVVGSLRGTQPLVHKYFVGSGDGTALYIGDFVKSGSSADAAGEYADVTAAAAGDVLRGVVVGVEINPTGVTGGFVPTVQYRKASVNSYVLVCDDPDAIFAIQEDSIGNTIAATNVGENADIVVAAGSTTTGYSGTMLDSSTHGGTGSAQLRILGIVAKPDNIIGTSAEILCLINKHEFKATAGV